MGKTPPTGGNSLVPARLYFCNFFSLGTLAYDFQSTEKHRNSPARCGATLGTPCLGRCSGAGCSRASGGLSTGGFARAAGDGLGCSPRPTARRTFVLKGSRSGGEALSEMSASSVWPCLQEQQSTTAVARQLHKKLITSNLVRELQPLGKHSVPFRGPGRRDHWKSGLEERN